MTSKIVLAVLGLVPTLSPYVYCEEHKQTKESEACLI